MTAQEFVADCLSRGIRVFLLAPGHPAFEVHEAGVRPTAKDKASLKAMWAEIAAYLERQQAVLKLREIHRGMGLSESDIHFVEEAMLSGQVAEVRIVVAPPQDGRPA